MRLTIICPAAHIADANNLAQVLGYGPADGLTYGEPGWQDADGNQYAVASLDVSDAFVTAATSPLVRPEWDTGKSISMAAARAQALVSLRTPGEGEGEDTPQASPGTILALAHPDPLAALDLAGLARVVTEE